MICFNLSLALCYFVPVFFSSLSIEITWLGEQKANLSAFRMFVRFALVWFCLFPLPLDVWEELRLVSEALPGLFSYLFFIHKVKIARKCHNHEAKPSRGTKEGEMRNKY